MSSNDHYAYWQYNENEKNKTRKAHRKKWDNYVRSQKNKQ